MGRNRVQVKSYKLSSRVYSLCFNAKPRKYVIVKNNGSLSFLEGRVFRKMSNA